MHCLRWWIPIFLLPLPAVSPVLSLLFVAAYAVRTKPCAYCSVIILGLMFSTCAFYAYEPLKSSSSSSALQNNVYIHNVETNASGSTTSPIKAETQRGQEIEATPSSFALAASSCWIDLAGAFTSRTKRQAHVADENKNEEEEEESQLLGKGSRLGWWSAPTNRKLPTIFRTFSASSRRRQRRRRQEEHSQQQNGKTQSNLNPKNGSITFRTWLQNIWNDGLYIGFGDQSGFKLKLLVD